MNQIGGGPNDNPINDPYKIKKSHTDSTINFILKIDNNTFNEDNINTSLSDLDYENLIVPKLSDSYCAILATLLLNNLTDKAIKFYKSIVLLDKRVAIKVLQEFNDLEEKPVLIEFFAGISSS